MNQPTNVVELEPVQLKNLEDQIIILAKNVQDERIDNSEIYALIDHLMSNTLFTRDFFVKTLESYNDSLIEELDPNAEDVDKGLDINTRFGLIDAYDFIVTIKKRQALNESQVNEIIS